MIKFNKLIIQNFVTYKRAVIYLNKGVVTLIHGLNKDYINKINNGVGKSLIGDAITFVLFGRTVRGFTSSHVQFNNKETLISLELTDRDNKYIISRNKKKSGGGVKILKNNKPVTKNSIKDNEEYIEKLIGCTFDIFRNSCLVGQGDTKKFVDSKPHEQDKMLGKLLMTEKIDEYANKAKAALKNINTYKDNIEMIEEDIGDTERELDDIIKSNNEWEREVREEIGKIKKEKKKYLKHIKEKKDIKFRKEKCKLMITGHKRNIKGLNEKVNKLDNKINSVQKEFIIVNHDVSAMHNSIQNNLKEIGNKKKLKGECPTCGVEITKDTKKSIISKIIKDNKKIMLEKDKKEIIQETFLDRTKGLKSRKKEIIFMVNSNQGAVDNLLKEINYIIKVINADKRIESVLKLSKKKSSEKTIDNMRKKLIKYKGKLTGFKVKQESSKNKIKKLEFWHKAFIEISKDILKNAIPILNKKAQEYLDIVMDKEMKINFRYSDKNKLETYVSDKKPERLINFLSGGEKRRASIAVNFSFAYLVSIRMSKAIDFIFIDEIFDTLDSVGIRKVAELIEYLHKDIKNIFIISHRDDLTFSNRVNNLKIIYAKGISQIDS